MSRKAAALNSAIGTGLGLLSQGMFADVQRNKDFAAQSALDSAQARREASLRALEREWQLADDAAAHQRSLEEIGARSEAEIEEAAAMREIAINNPTPYEQARLAGAEASAEASRARTGLLEVQTEAERRALENPAQDKDLFGVVRPDAYTPGSIQKFQDTYERTGRRQWSLLKPRSGADSAAKIQREIQERAGEMAERLFKDGDSFGVANLLYKDPQLAQSLGITENTPTPEAVVKVENAFAKSFAENRAQPQSGNRGAAADRQSGGLLDDVIGQAQVISGGSSSSAGSTDGTPISAMGTMPGAGQQPRGQQASPIVQEALSVIQRGADPAAVIQRMRENGVSEAEIRQVQQAAGNVR